MRFREYPTQAATTLAIIVAGCVAALGVVLLFSSFIGFVAPMPGTMLFVIGSAGVASALYARSNGSSVGWVERVEDTSASGDDAENDPLQVMLAEEQRLRKQRESMSAAPQPPSRGDGIAGQLERLATMHRAGELTNDEFAAAKTQLLRGDADTVKP